MGHSVEQNDLVSSNSKWHLRKLGKQKIGIPLKKLKPNSMYKLLGPYFTKQHFYIFKNMRKF